MATKPLCSIPGCGKPAHSRGWCQMHYRRNWLYGDPLKMARDPDEARRYMLETVFSHRGQECLIWPFSRVQFGYGRVSIEGRVHRVHRLACEEINGAPPSSKHQALHSCGNGHLGCVNPQHLVWGTHLENAHDTIAHGTSSRGTKNPKAVLNETMVRQIRAMKGTISQNEIAAKFSVSKQTVSLLLKGGIWSWLE